MATPQDPSFAKMYDAARDNAQRLLAEDAGRGTARDYWRNFINAAVDGDRMGAWRNYAQLAAVAGQNPNDPTNKARTLLNSLRSFLATPATPPTLEIPQGPSIDYTGELEAAERASRLAGVVSPGIVPPHAGLDAPQKSTPENDPFRLVSRDLPPKPSFLDKVRSVFNRAPTTTQAQQTQVISAPAPAPSASVTTLPVPSSMASSLRPTTAASAIPKSADEMIELMNTNADAILSGIPKSATNTRYLAKELRDAARSGDKEEVVSLMRELSGASKDGEIFGKAVKKLTGDTSIEMDNFAQLPPSTSRRPDGDSIVSRIYNYLRERGREISFESVKNLVSRYKGPILGLVGIAAAAAIIYGAYRLYKYVKPGVVSTPGGPLGPIRPNRPGPPEIPPQVLDGTIKEVLDALAAEFPWIRANIGTARSILVNGFEAGNFERAVESLVERATAAKEGRGMRKKHRGAGVMMV